MSGESITLRDAEPTIEEGLVFARYLDTAAEGFMHFLLGRRAPQILAQAYTMPNNEYSFRNVVFAEDDGNIVGMTASFTAAERAGFSNEPLRQAEGFPAVRTGLLHILCWPLIRVLTTIPDDSFYLLAIAVDDEARGKGVGSALMDHVEEQARRGGSNRLHLDVASKNEGARRLYERRGMVVESRWPKLRLLPPFLLRMAKDL